MLANVYFFNPIEKIGGIETFVYELCSKYDYEIVIYYERGDAERIERLREVADVRKYEKGMKIKCKKAFFQYNYQSFIDNVDAEEYIYVIHANFMDLQGLVPPVRKFDRYIAVSKIACKQFEERTGNVCEVCGLPLVLPKRPAPLFLLSAQRMTSEKGAGRIQELVKRLDAETDFEYYYIILTNQKQWINVDSPNVVVMPPKMDARGMINACDVFVALSNTESFGLSVAEKLNYGTGKLLVTPCEAYNEQHINGENSIVLDFDLSNMDDVVEKLKDMYSKNYKDKLFEYKMVKDNWGKYLDHTPKKYKGKIFYRVKATDIYQTYGVFDNMLSKVPKKDEEFVVNGERLDTLQNFWRGSLVEVVEEIVGKTQADIQNEIMGRNKTSRS